MPNEYTEFQDLLMKAFLKFQEQGRKQGRGRWKIKSETEFARWLGIKQATLNSWINDPNRKPDLANTILLAEKIGPEVYDALGYPRVYVPRSRELRFIIEAWEYLTDDERSEILRQARFDAGICDGEGEHVS